jgi:hypothetical protein
LFYYSKSLFLVPLRFWNALPDVYISNMEALEKHSGVFPTKVTLVYMV